MSGVNPDLRAGRAFTLLEVVVAIGIFAVGMVAVIGLFSPVAKSVGDLADAEAATHVAELLSVQLQAQEAADLANHSSPFSSLAARLMVSVGKSHQLTLDDANPNYNVATDTTHLLFASHDGTKIGAYNDTKTWTNGDGEKFFEIVLIRNETLSPPSADATATMLAYTARLRWPAFVSLAGSATGFQPGQAAPGAAVPFDYSQKRVLFFAGSVTR